MSAEIFNAPSDVKVPSLSIKTGESINDQINNYHKACDKFVSDLKQWLNDKGFSGKNSGEIIKFQVADGYAEYMVVSMKPLRLIHLPLGDAWDFQYVHLLTAKEVQEQIDRQKKLAELFGSVKK